MAALPPGTQSPFVWNLRVYWEDTDAGGVVFYANYLKFFERARTEWLRALGVEQESLRRERQMQFVVTHSEVRYLRPARLDDWLQISVQPSQSGRASVLITQEARRDGELLAEGRIRIACVDAVSFALQRMPEFLLVPAAGKPAA